MVGPSRLVALALALAGFNLTTAWADDPKPKAPAKPADKPSPADFGLPGEDPPAAFVPRAPRTVAQQKQVEALRLYTEARALEDEGDLVRAIAGLEKALAIEPDSVPVLRRLSLLSGARGLKERSVEYSRRVLAAEPGDLVAIGVVIDYYIKTKHEPAKAEAFLKEVLASPKLDKTSSESILLEYELTKLYDAMGQTGKAAETLIRVVDAIDSKAGNRLTPADRRRILGENEAQAYLTFGEIFFKAKRLDLATRCFRRAAVYDDSNPQLPVLLAEIYLIQNQPAEALTQLEKALTRRVQDPRTFQLLAVILARLNREKELLPRLEAAAKVDPRNVPLQYILAELYRSTGNGEKADALLRSLLELRQDLRGFETRFASLLKDKKTEELLHLLEKAYETMKRVELLDPKIDAIIADRAYADTVLDTGLAMLKAKPPRLDDQYGAVVLARIGVKAGKDEKHIELLRWLNGEKPNLTTAIMLAEALVKQKRFAEAVTEVEAMLARYPDERANPEILTWFSVVLVEVGKEDQAIGILKDVLKQTPNNVKALRSLAQALIHKGKTDEGIAAFREPLKNNPTDEELIRSYAFLLRSAGRIDEEVAYLKSLLEKFPNNNDIDKLAHSTLSLAYTDLGDFPKAEAELEVLYAKDPTDIGVNNDLGYLYADQGKNLEKAEAMIRKAVEQADNNSAYLDSLGWVLFKRGKLKEAIPPLEKAIELLQTEGRDDATVPEHLGDVYFALKDRVKARAAWEKAEKISAATKPPDKRLAEIRKKLDALKQLDNSPRPATGANP
jgi:tetratricopeptide (TPR) repeat protein